MNAIRKRSMALAFMLVGMTVSGCGTYARWVNCEGRLERINLPAPKAEHERALKDLAQTSKEQTVR